MTDKNQMHTFHIPVMGLAFTIDSPIKVAALGISSVVSIVDDELIEKMRAFYSQKFTLPYNEITKKIRDYRASRITAYLNMMDEIVTSKFNAFKSEIINSKAELEKYISTLPNASEFKKNIQRFIDEGTESIKNYIEENLCPGKIDVNIMTKLDKDNFEKDEQLPIMYNDAHAALRGFANSTLNSSVVLSAGMNPRLYSYMENFTDFYPDALGQIKKKIIIKVSDYRSAMVQGSFLAKKGIWVSEFRIESGLNCGGHAFATDGFLMGPVLEEFKEKKSQLIQTMHELIVKAWNDKNITVPAAPLSIKVTAQGGVGTAEEHGFLLDHYQLDSVGWGSPFLLVPEATTVDASTRMLLAKAKEEDFYLSNISPLGVPFNTVKGTSNDHWKQVRIDAQVAGSSCPKKHLALSKEYDKQGVCTASKKYQDIKLAELNAVSGDISVPEYEERKTAITEKSCLCVGLANSAYMENDVPVKGQQQGVVICPGPNLAYFDKEVSLSAMTKHIYGNENVLPDADRPHMFLKELKMYIDNLKKEMASSLKSTTELQIKKWKAYKTNLEAGIAYYENLFTTSIHFATAKKKLLVQLKESKALLAEIETGVTIPV
ncbi:hypothetical protein [Pinibacter aurantiacus]|uniref:Uncharacterized protein n=1 Tax=Pinibacter aurantiacus TaxID=2851599 RepID=A0A9E2SD80_9BACT|nr:hypothetical protein [Pinibacter aurantiacus]MBV4357700.1 hypothetical protein [Pinibacter aurantiacus]